MSYEVRTTGVSGTRVRSRVNSSLRQAAGFRRLLIEPLEQRRLLAAVPIISEFLASNGAGLRDAAGNTADWLEIYNPDSQATINLDSTWKLSCSGNNWKFPTMNLGPGEFRVIFCTGNDEPSSKDPNGELHADFKLSQSGDDLSLWQGTTKLQDIAYTDQQTDVSYGLGEQVTETKLVAAGATARYYAPADGSLGLNWTQQGFNDSTWAQGPTGLGYVSMVPGFAVSTYVANSLLTVNTLENSKLLMSTPGDQSSTTTETDASINYLNNGTAGHFVYDTAFPGLKLGVAQSNFAVHATGRIHISAAGTWTFGVNSDDGFQLGITNSSGAAIALSGSSTGTTYSNGLMYVSGTRTSADSFGTVTFASGGDYNVDLVYFQNTSTAEAELYAAAGSFTTWAGTTNWRLVGDTAGGGLSVVSNPINASPNSIAGQVKTNVSAAMTSANSLYVRIPFTAANLASLSTLTLKMAYNDGYVAYLNGVQVANKNVPASPAWNSLATAARTGDVQSSTFENVDVTAFLNSATTGHLLTVGNVLAIQVLKASTSDSNLLVVPELSQIVSTQSDLHFFATPTPAAANSQQFWQKTAAPKFSVKHGIYDAPTALALSTTTAGADTWYTLDGSDPNVPATRSVASVGAGMTLTSLTSSGTTATATLAGHGLQVGQSVLISGASPTIYNGTFAITAITSSTFTYTLGSSYTGSATGTVLAQPYGISRNGTTAIVWLTNHGLSNGNTVIISGADLAAYNGQFTISAVTANTFSYAVSGSPASPATGTIVARKVPAVAYQGASTALTSLTGSTTTATATWANHGLQVGQVVLISGASVSNFNGSFAVTAVTQNTFAYTITSYTGSAGGTPLAQVYGISRSSATAIVWLPGHTFSVGDYVFMSGAVQTDYNGVFAVTAATLNTFSYTVANSPASPATGTTITASRIDRAVSGIIRVGWTATATAAVHDFIDGDVVSIVGSDQSQYNGIFTIRNVTANTFDFTVSGTPTTPATGKMAVIKLPHPYTGPITLSTTSVVRAASYNSVYQPSDSMTETYLFLDDVIKQPAYPDGVPGSWSTWPADYQMDPRITTDPAYRDSLKQSLMSIPTMSLVSDVDNFFDATKGIYANTAKSVTSNYAGAAMIVPGSVEYFDPNSSDDFQIAAGLQLYGGVSRSPQYRKHNFRLRFDDPYGPGQLDFPLFGKDAADKFDSIILRSQFNDAWTWAGSAVQYIRTEFAADTHLAMGDPDHHSQFVQLYVDGLYWGLYQATERPDAAFSASYMGGDSSDWEDNNAGYANGVTNNLPIWNTMMNDTKSGVTTTLYKANVTVNSISTALGVINTPSQQTSSSTATAAKVNYITTGTDGHYTSSSAFPGLTAGTAYSNIVAEVRTTVSIPTAGVWTFGVSCKDGFKLTLTSGSNTFTSQVDGTRSAPIDTLATFNIPAADGYKLDLVFYQNSSGAELELYAAPGTWTAWSQTSTWKQVGDNFAGGLGTSLADMGTVTVYQANVPVTSLTDAQTVVANSPLQAAVNTEYTSTVNYINTGSEGHYTGSVAFPGTTAGTESDNFVVQVQTTLTIPTTGAWTFDVNADDGAGFALYDGVTLLTPASQTTSGTDTLRVYNLTHPGLYNIQVLAWQNVGTAGLELSAASGTYASFTPSVFRLVGDTANGGLTVGTGMSVNDMFYAIQGKNSDGTRNPDLPIILDMQNYIDYMLMNFYIGNADWPSHNFYSAADDTGYKFYEWDSEWSVDSWQNPTVPKSVLSTDMTASSVVAAQPYYYLFASPDFKMLFADRAQKFLYNGGALTPAASVARYQALSDEVQWAMIGESARWGDVPANVNNGTQPHTAAEWSNERNNIIANYLPQRTGVVITQLQNKGLLPTLAAPSFSLAGTSKYGGVFNPGDALTMSGSGTIWYTLDGSDPRMPLGTRNPTAIQYTGPLVLTTGIAIHARVLSGSTWSALADVSFYPNLAPSIRITEVMYNPAAPNSVETAAGFTASDFEFIEIKNIGSSSVSLAGMTFSNGIDFTFPNVSLAAGGYLVVAANPEAFHFRYPGVTNYLGGMLLATGATAKTLIPTSNLGTTWTQINYTETGWTAGTTGVGYEQPRTALPAESEPNDSLATASSAVFNFSPYTSGNRYQLGITGTAGSTDDWFKIGALQSGNVITIAAAGASSFQGTSPNLCLELWRSGSGSPVIVNDDGGPGQDALISRFAVATTDNYYVKVRRADVSVLSGTYQLGLWLETAGASPLTGAALTEEDEPNDDYAGANDASASWRPVQYLSRTGGTMSSTADADYYECDFAAGDLVTINIDSTSSLDAKVTLLDGSGNILALEDGTSDFLAPYNLDSPIYAWLIPDTGAYYVKVQSASGTGAYNADVYLSSGTTPPGTSVYTPLIGTDVKATMYGVNSSAYIRVPFTVSSLSSISTLALRMKYDDGFVAYLNGTQVASRNAPTTPAWNSAATATHPVGQSLQYEDIDLTSCVSLLVSGTNVLAIQALNTSASSDDLLIAPKLVYNGWSGHLDNGGEKIELDSPIGGVIHEFTYSDSWYSRTDGIGFSLTVRDPLQALSLWDTGDGWRPSAAPGGSPAAGDSLALPGSVIVNEALTHSMPPAVDQIELYNTTAQTIDISGWYVSDSQSNLAKYEIPAGTTLAAHSYLVLTESANFGNVADPAHCHVPFALNAHGDNVYLTSNVAGSPLVPGGYQEHVNVDASPPDVTIGLETKSTGGTDFALQQAPTFGAVNGIAYVAPLVLSEVMYHPAEPTAAEQSAGYVASDFEYIELYNRSSTAQTLANFSLGDGVGFTFGWPADGTASITGTGNEVWTLESGATATWTAAGLAAGTYAVYAHYTLYDGDGNRRSLDDAAQYTITGSAVPTTVTINQNTAAGPDGWVSLGSYAFNGNGSVLLTRGATGPGDWTIGDAVKFVKVGQADVVLGSSVLDSRAIRGTATVAPGGYVVLVGNYAAFDARYHVAANNIPVAGVFTGNLDDNGEMLRLYQAGAVDLGMVPQYEIDHLSYGDNGAWPTEADGSGAALIRVHTSAYGNDAVNWKASTVGGTPGRVNVSIDRSPPTVPGGLAGHVTVASGPTITLIWTASQDAQSAVDHYVVYRDGQALASTTATSYADTGVAAITSYSYQVSAVNRDGFESGLSSPVTVTVPGIVSSTTPDKHIEIVFSEPLNPATAGLLSNYTLNGVAPGSVSLANNNTKVIVNAASSLTVGSVYTLAMNNLTTVSGNQLPASLTYAFNYVPQGSGYVLREYWLNIGTGTAVTDLTGNAAYPNSPSGTSYQSSLEAPWLWGTNYGTRMRGYISPPVTGNYYLWIASDDSSELWLSTDENPANKVKIAYLSGSTTFRNWTANATQASAAKALVAGQRYYIEVLHKQGGTIDNLSVRWQLPGSLWENGDSNAPIPGIRLSPYNGLPDITGPSLPQNLKAQVAGGNTQINLSWSPSSDAESSVDHYAIYRDGSSTVYATSATTSFSDSGLVSSARHSYQVAAFNAAGFAGPRSTAISVSPTGTATVPAPPFAVTVVSLATADPTPALTGTVTDPVLAVTVRVNGSYYVPTINGDVWTVPDGAIAALPDGLYDVQVTATDSSGNTVFDATTNELVVDTAAPAATVNVVGGTPRNTAASQVTIIFSGPVTGFDLGDLRLSLNGGSDLITGGESLTTSDSITWTLSGLAGLTGLPGTYTLTIGAAGAQVQDVAGNPLAGDAVGTWVMIVTPPTVAITAVTPNPRNTAVSQLQVVFSQPVNGLDLADLRLTRDAGANLLTGSQTVTTSDHVTWAVGNLSGLTLATGTYAFTLIAAGSGIVDYIGNSLAADAAGAWVTDSTPPTAAITAVTPNPRNTAVSQLQIVFSEPVNGLDLADLRLTRDGGANLLTGSQTVTTSDHITWTVGNLSGLTAATGAYALTLIAAGSGIVDYLGNPLVADAAGAWVTDSTPPTAAITAVTPNPRSMAVSQLQIIFSEAVNGLDVANLRLTRDGGDNLITGSQTINTSDHITWTVGNLSGLTLATGTYAFTLIAASSGIVDYAGNPLAVDAAGTWAMDTTPPTAQIAQVTPNPRRTAVTQLQIVFSKPITGLDLADLQLTRDGGANLLTPSQTLTSSDQTTWRLGNISGLDAVQGAYTLTLIANGSGIQDLLGNALSAGALRTWTVDLTPPTASVVPITPNPRASPLPEVQIVFSEPVTGLDLSDLQLARDGGSNLLTASQTLTSSDWTTWTLGNLAGLDALAGNYALTLTAMFSGIRDLALNAMATDAAGTWIVDAAAPTAAITSIAPNPRTTTVSQIQVVFSEPVSGFDMADLQLTRDGGANLLTASQTLTTSDQTTWTLGNLSGLTTHDGAYVLTLTVVGAGIRDLAGNSFVTGSSTSWQMAAGTIHGESGDRISLACDAGNPGIVNVSIVPTSGTTTSYSASRDGFDHWQIAGTDGNTQLTVDYCYGNPLPTGGLVFDGGAAPAGNTLWIKGSSANDTVSMTAGQVIVNGSPPITYGNVGYFGFDLGAGQDSLGLAGTTLRVNQDNAISAGTTVTITGGGILDLGGHQDTVAAVVVTSGNIINGSLSGSSYAAAAGTLSGNLRGTGSLTKSGSGTVTLSGNNSYQGGTNVLGGRLLVTSLTALPVNQSLSVGSGASVVFATSLGLSAAPTGLGASTLPRAAANSPAAIDTTTSEDDLASAKNQISESSVPIQAVPSVAETTSPAIADSALASDTTLVDADPVLASESTLVDAATGQLDVVAPSSVVSASPDFAAPEAAKVDVASAVALLDPPPAKPDSTISSEAPVSSTAQSNTESPLGTTEYPTTNLADIATPIVAIATKVEPLAVLPRLVPAMPQGTEGPALIQPISASIGWRAAKANKTGDNLANSPLLHATVQDNALKAIVAELSTCRLNGFLRLTAPQSWTNQAQKRDSNLSAWDEALIAYSRQSE